jgi:peptidoglycan/LPS O-acetylase OafA/YrhL
MAYAFALKHWAFCFGLPADTAIALAGAMTLALSSFTYSLVERPLTVALKRSAIVATYTCGRT